MDAASLKLRIGLTGGIGSGKSTVGKMFERLGAAIIDADLVARQLTAAGGAAIGALANAFGQEFITQEGALDRVRMREAAFADVSVKRMLEAILHPMIGLETDRLAEAIGPARVLVFDVPLLVESRSWRARVDKVLVIDCAESTQRARVEQRSGWSALTAQAVIDRQSTRGERRACADAVVFNETLTLEELQAEVIALWQRWN